MMTRLLQYIRTPFGIFLTLCVLFALFVGYNTYLRATSKHVQLDSDIEVAVNEKHYEKIIVAGGCFWCTESEYNHETGVVSAVSGYADVSGEYAVGDGPRYADVSSGAVKAREAVQVVYDPKIIATERILELYFKHIDPTDSLGQFADRGYQYSPAIYYMTDEQKNKAQEIIRRIVDSKKFDSPVTVVVAPFTNFYPAEEYHQDYKDKNPVRYAVYREGSGRNAFVTKNWADDSVAVSAIFPHTLAMTSQPWTRISPDVKAARIQELTPLQVEVTQREGTERPFDNEYNANKEVGIYVDIVSGEPLFLSTDKYDSGTGWPSFVRPVSTSSVMLREDKRLFSTRVEVRSVYADSHLGHVFDDGPQDKGGKRYCMNSAAMRFIPVDSMAQEGYGEYIQALSQ